MKTIEILDKGNTTNKLTITTSRVTIKLQSGISKQESIRVIQFFTNIMGYFEHSGISYRGSVNISIDPMMITLCSDSKKSHFTFNENGINGLHQL